MSVRDTSAVIEAYLDALRAAGLIAFERPLAPQSEEDLAGLERELELTLPDDVRHFLRRGLRAGGGSFEDGDRFSSFGFTWSDASAIVTSTRMLRHVARDIIDPDPGDLAEHARLVHRGAVLTGEEPFLLVADGVYHFSYRNPIMRVADGFAAFLEAWLASGCFVSHDFTLHMSRVRAYLPGTVDPAANSWIAAYRGAFARIQS